jgi:hypothetical protein
MWTLAQLLVKTLRRRRGLGVSLRDFFRVLGQAGNAIDPAIVVAVAQSYRS